MKLDASKMIIVDLYSGKYNQSNVGHEIYNLNSNPIDNKYYGFCPPYDGIAIERFGAKPNEEFIYDILVVYVAKKTNSSNREIIAICRNATIYRKGQIDNNLCRYFKDKDGKEKVATYSIVSDNIIDLRAYFNKFEININEYNNWMFRKQRVYAGTYPKLDKDILKYLEKLLENKLLLNNDEDQNEIQCANPANIEEIRNSSNKPLSIVNDNQGKVIAKDSKVAKAALKASNYICEIDSNHQTFITKQNVPYMEGHHLIPCTVANSEYFFTKYGKNIDCFENIVSLCPNCHRELHYGEWKTKSKKLRLLFNEFKFKLINVGIDITEKEFLTLYR